MGNISFEKIWEDQYFFELKCSASSELISVSINSYCTDHLIDELMKKINSFTDWTINQFTWETSENGNNSTPNFKMKVFYINPNGHIRVEVFCEIDDGASLDEHHCCFYVDGIEGWQLQQFAKRLNNLKFKGNKTIVSIL